MMKAGLSGEKVEEESECDIDGLSDEDKAQCLDDERLQREEDQREMEKVRRMDKWYIPTIIQSLPSLNSSSKAMLCIQIDICMTDIDIFVTNLKQIT